MRTDFARLTLPARVESVRPFCEFARRVAARAEFTAEQIDQLELVIEEILVNIARHGYVESGAGEAELACAVESARRLRVVVSDQGRPFNPLASKAPDLNQSLAERQAGGLGIFLVKSLAEELDYERDGERNVLKFTFAIG
jgi:anti-sigma regulatory factor (Ser/Thr protein kinase)